ncbi:MAG: DUF2905 domain-containing protein [Planctomycetota bacterium]
MTPETVGKWIMAAGLVLVAGGGLVWLAGRSGLPLGRLPGDIRVETDHGSFYVPVTTCLVISAVLSLVMMLVRFLLRR